MSSRSKDPQKRPDPASQLARDSSGDSVYAATVPLSGDVSLPKTTANLPRLPDGELVAGRYRIVRYLARGGMGEVYEAEDQELRERIALKTIRDEVQGAVAEERFKREIQLSRKVTHPNVCRIFDVGFHLRDSGERVVFLTMELLAGETLLERVRRDGPLSLDDAAGVVRQICAGLTAAHAVNVVHRDLKSANVMLVPRPTGGIRAVVTDFGLAHMTGATDDKGRSLSGSGGIVGTPGYMAPEQVEGGEITDRTDVYSLGVVMYEIVTGRLPFEGATPLSIAAKRLTTAPPSPRKLRPELPARWELATLACLERAPRSRPATPRAVLEMLEEELERTSLHLAKLNRRAPLARPFLAVLMIVVAAVVTIRLLRGRHGGLGEEVRRRGVVLGSFDAVNPMRDGGHAVAARHAMRTDLLFDVPVVETRVVLGLPGEQMLSFGVELPRPSEVAPLRLDGRLDVAAPGPERAIELTLRLVDPVTNEQRTLLVEHGDLRHLEESILKAGDRLRALLDLRPPSATALSAEGRKTLEAARVSIRRGELAEAVELIESGLRTDPNSVELRFLLARALAGLRVDVASAVATRRTIQLGPAADPFWGERVRALALRRDATLSASVIEALARAHPEDLDLQLDLALVLAQAQRHVEALRMLDALAAGDRSPEQRVRIGLTSLTLRARREDYAPVVAGYPALRARAEALGLPGLALDAQLLGCGAAASQGVADVVDVACAGLDGAARKQRRFDGVVQAATTVSTMTIQREGPTQLVAATREYALASRLGGRRLLSDALNNLALAIAESGPTPWPLFEEALAVARDVHDHATIGVVLQNMAYYAGEEGRVRDQGRYLRESMEQARDNEAPETIAYISCQLGHVQARLADLPGARRSLEEGLTALAHGADPWGRFSCAMLVTTLETESGNFELVHRALEELLRSGAGGLASEERHFDALYRTCETLRLEGKRREAHECAVALESGKQASSVAAGKLQTEILRRITAIELGRGGTTFAEAAALRTRVEGLKALGSRLWIELDLFALERLLGVPAEVLLPRVDHFIAEMASHQHQLAELTALIERLRVLARDHSSKVAEEVAPFVARATRQGFLLRAREAAALRAGPGR